MNKVSVVGPESNKGVDGAVHRVNNKVLQISLIEPFIREISVKVLEEVMLEEIPVRDMVVDHAFNSLLNLSGAVLENRIDLLLVIDNIMEGTETFIVVQEVSDVGVVTSEELRG